MTKKANDLACVFCEGTGPRSPEHVFPLWISRLLHPGSTVHHLPGDYQRGSRGTVPSRARPFKAKRMELTTRSVCKVCNTGWMSDLESRVAPYMGLMIGGQKVTLSLEQQADVALWAVKTILMYEQTRAPEYQHIGAEQYRAVFKRRQPPPPSTVRTGVYMGNQMPIHLNTIGAGLDGVIDPRRPSAPLEEARRNVLHAHRGLILIGALLFEITGTNLPQPVDLQWPGDTGRGLVPIWPIINRTLDWPPTHYFGDPGMSIFLDPPGFRFQSLHAPNGDPIQVRAVMSPPPQKPSN